MSRFPIYCSLLSALASVSVVADVESDLFDLSLRQLMNFPVEGATKTQETVSSVPAAVTVFDEQFIQSLGVDYLYELLNFVPGYQSHRNPDAPMAYGYSTRGRRNGGRSKEVLLLVDGQVMNDPRTSSANGAIRLMSVKPIERVEVIRGPGSALYGSGAYSGVINIVTRRDYQIIHVKAGLGGEAGVSGNLTDETMGWALNGNFNWERDGGDSFTLDNHFTTIDDEDVLHTRDAFSLGEINLNAIKGQTKLGLIVYSLEADGFYSIETVSPDFSYNRVRTSMVYWEQEWRWLESVDSKWTASYVHVNQDFNSQITGEGAFADDSAPPYSDPLSNDALFLKAFVEEEAVRINLHNNWQYNESTSMQLGIGWQRSELLVSKAANNFDAIALGLNQFPIAYYGNFDNFSVAEKQSPLDAMGIYSQALLQVSESNQINLGLRFDSTESESSHFSPRLGWVHHLNDNETFKVLYGEAFRAATLNETASPDSPILQGDPNLKHEVIRTLDLLYLYQQSDLNVQLGLFSNQYEDPIGVEVINNVRRYTNGESSTSSGVEFEMNYNLDSGSWIRFTHMEIFDKPRAFFREAGRHSSLLYNTHHGKWWYNLSMVYGGEKAYLSGSEQVSIPDYATFNAKVQYQLNHANIASFQIKNLLDETVYSAPQGNRLQEAIPDRGIQIRLEFTHQLD
jgi:iron complex outermembrane receptor protein